MSEIEDPPVLNRSNVVRRNESFAKCATTKIWQEESSIENPYIAAVSRCHGYELLELMQKRSFVEVLYLLFQGELPDKNQAQLLEHLMVALINPGPRHPATRAAMYTGVGKTDSAHILPIGLSILGGEHLGAVEVESAVRWLRKQCRHDPRLLADQLKMQLDNRGEGDIHIAPGFGCRYGGVDLLPKNIAEQLMHLPGAGDTLAWGNEFSAALNQYHMGWLSTGLAAAVFCDLGFQPRMAPGLFQLMCAPGLFAHGIEQANKPLSVMPFPDDKDYILELDEESSHD